MNKVTVHPNFTTRDLQLASYLSANSFPLIALDRADPKRIEFCFEEKEGLQEAIQIFHRGEALIEPQLFAAHQKLVKNRLFSH